MISKITAVQNFCSRNAGLTHNENEEIFHQNKAPRHAQYLHMRMISRCSDELGEALAEPHSNVSFHVDSKRFKTLLQPTDGKVTKTADILTQVDPADLGQAQTAHRYEA